MLANKALEKIDINGKDLIVNIVLPYFNENIGLELLENTKEELINRGVRPEKIRTTRVAGCLEIPFTCTKLIKRHSPDVVIALGIVVRGETTHYELVTNTTFDSIMRIQIEYKTPIIFGILTCENLEQAKERASKEGQNKGKEIAITAIMQAKI